MKSNSTLVSIAIAGAIVASPILLSAVGVPALQVSAQQNLNAQQKIAGIVAVKGKPTSAQLMREYYKDLTPIGIQPGGAGMVVNLYSKKDDTTLSLCTMYDVVVAVKKGRIAKFDPQEVK
jgi:hypothetical protein